MQNILILYTAAGNFYQALRKFMPIPPEYVTGDLLVKTTIDINQRLAGLDLCKAEHSNTVVTDCCVSLFPHFSGVGGRGGGRGGRKK